jgi:Rieske Fe-S protein
MTALAAVVAGELGASSAHAFPITFATGTQLPGNQRTALRWRQEEMRFQCPRHGSKYQPDGTFISGRATRNMDRFAVQRQGEAILVDLNRLYRSDEQAALWTAAVVSL